MTVEEALAELLGDRRTGVLADDLVAAAREALRRRKVNTDAGGTVIGALRKPPFSFSLDQVRGATGIPNETARRWSVPPDEVKYTDEGGERSDGD